MNTGQTKLTLLAAGDLVVLGLVTAAGFASHNTLASAGGRIWTTFVPLVVSWVILGFHLGAFDTSRAQHWKELWRPFWAMILAAPLAGWLRAVWLDSTVVPLFVVIIGGISALSLLAWRALFTLFWQWKTPSDG